MIVGNSQRFAIEVEPGEILDGWLLGRLRFWVGGEAVGNWEDAADLRACARWLADFAAHPKDRYEPAFDRASTEDVMRAVCDERGVRDNPVVEDVSGRFYISHLGMSSFDAIDLLLVFTAEGGERCIWHDARTGRMGEAKLECAEMESVAAEFCRRFDEVLATLPARDEQ